MNQLAIKYNNEIRLPGLGERIDFLMNHLRQTRSKILETPYLDNEFRHYELENYKEDLIESLENILNKYYSLKEHN